MDTLATQWAGITNDIERLDRLSALATSIRQHGMSHDTMVALESVEPGMLLRDIPSTAFTIDPSDVRQSISLERIGYLKAGIIGGLLAALIAFLVKLFRGRTANKHHARDMQNAKEEATEADDQFSEVREAAAEETQNTSTTLTRDELKKLYNHLIKIGLEEADARKWTADTHAVRDYFFHSKTYRDDILSYAMDKCCFPILLADDYLQLQDELRNVVTAILPEAPNRIAYLGQLAAYARMLYDTQNIFIRNHEFDPVPTYTADIGMMRLYTSTTGDTTRGVSPIVDDFNGKVAQLFTPMKAPGKQLLSPLLVDERYTTVLKDTVTAAIEYEDYYISKGVKGIEGLSIYVEELERAMKDKHSIDSQREKVFILYDIVKDELRATARIASTMIMIRERSERIVSVLQNATTTLTTARELIESLRKQLKISKYYSNESLEPVAETNPIAALEMDDEVIVALLGQADALESIHNQITYAGTISRRDAATINTIGRCEALRVTDYTQHASKVGLQPALESMSDLIQKAARAIIEFISNTLKRLISWLRGTSNEDNLSTRKANLAKTFKTFVARQELSLRLVDQAMAAGGLKPISEAVDIYHTKGKLSPQFPTVRGAHPNAVQDMLFKALASEPNNRINALTMDIIDGKFHTRTAIELTTAELAIAIPRLTASIQQLAASPDAPLDHTGDIARLKTYAEKMYTAIKDRPTGLPTGGFKAAVGEVVDIHTRLSAARAATPEIVLDASWLTKVNMDSYFSLLTEHKAELHLLEQADKALAALRKNTNNTPEFKAGLEELTDYLAVVTKLTVMMRNIRSAARVFLKVSERITGTLIGIFIIAHQNVCKGTAPAILRKEARVLERAANTLL